MLRSREANRGGASGASEVSGASGASGRKREGVARDKEVGYPTEATGR